MYDIRDPFGDTRTYRIALVDVDRTGFPNLALMKLSAWHKQRGDSVTLIRDNCLPIGFDQIYASVVFSWNRYKAEVLQAVGAIVGGTGIDLKAELPPLIEAMRPDYSLYQLDYGIGYLMRGCIWNCGFCVVPQKEGKPREVATLDDLLHVTSTRRRPFVVLLDNEFFWREKWAIARLQEFTTRGVDFCPSQGLDVRVVTPALAQALAASPFWNLHRTRRQITFAFDNIRIEALYRRGVERLLAAGIKAWQLQSFVLVGYDSTFDDDLRRLEIIQSYGIDPFVMIYRDPASGAANTDPQLRNLARWVNRRLYRVCTFREYVPNLRGSARAVVA